ncbi:MAG: glutathione S-transferase family protein [Alphaproteobacteria bacterium]|nr:glutathione S-transferase family protein [Alphaproteobacteria bacterium]
MRAKDVDFKVTYINLREKPDWFLKISPHGKVPVLNVDDVPLFESNAIAEYLDEVVSPRLHPADPVKRARNRAWTDFVPTFSAALGKINYAKTEADVAAGIEAAKPGLERIEKAIATERGNDGPFFNGPDLSLVDAAYAPFLQRYLIVDDILRTGLLDGYPLVTAWARALLSDDRVTGAVAAEFPAEFDANLERRGTYAWSLKQARAAAE